MALITWSPSLSVGVKDIDDQHKRLVEILNEFHDAVILGENLQHTLVTLTELAEYTDYHFGFEELLMKKHNYKFSEQHAYDHLKLRFDVKNYIEEYKRGALDPEVICKFLKKWLFHHISGSDRHLGKVISGEEANAE